MIGRGCPQAHRDRFTLSSLETPGPAQPSPAPYSAPAMSRAAMYPNVIAGPIVEPAPA
ncbi:hypothetical protein GCM10010228_42270 [Streptomyces massasporeus]|nr:hypothetical protein GCM10010228_42270 [Streptomyces massasporeus]